MSRPVPAASSPHSNFAIEVFRELYSAIGFGPIVALTRLPGISQILNLGHQLFAKNRLRITSRCTDETCPVHNKPQES